MRTHVNEQRFFESLLIISSLFIWALLSVVVIWMTQRYHMVGDLAFHWQRINELRVALKHLSLPTLATNYFSGNGAATMLFYPNLTLIPIALLANVIHNPIELFASFFLLCDFTGLIVSYYACHSINRSRSVSYLFAVAYTSGLNFLLPQDDYGNVLAISFLPLAFFGVIALIRHGHWLEMTLGVTLIIYSHVLDSIITIGFLAIIIMLNCPVFFKWRKLKQIYLAALVTVVSTTAFWLPALKIGSLNQLVKPFSTILRGETANQIVKYVIVPKAFFFEGTSLEQISVNVFGLLAIVLSLIYYQRLSRLARQLFWTAIVLIVMYSQLARPLLNLIHETPLRYIQFPSRISIIPNVILCYLFAKILIQEIDTVPALKRGLRDSAVALAVTMPLSIQFYYVSVNNPCHRYAQPITPQRVINTHQLYSNRFAGRTDYYPGLANYDQGFLIKDQGFYGMKHHKIKFFSHDNGSFTFTTRRPLPKLVVPFVEYHGLRYQIRLDRRAQPIRTTKHQIFMLSHVPAGTHRLQISIPTDPMIDLSRIISLLGLAAWLSALIRSKMKWRSKIKASR